MTMELMHGKKDRPESPPSRLILYLKTRSPDYREQIRKIKCSRDTHQAQEVYSAIERATNTYGPVKPKVWFLDAPMFCSHFPYDSLLEKKLKTQ